MTARLLTFSTLYPSAVRPQHGIFVETRLRHLLASGKAETRVVAPVPWFPATGRYFGAYGGFAKAPREEVRHGIEVLHPRYFLPPRIGMNVAPFLLALAMRPVLKRIIAGGYDFDLIDAHYFYPDGVAAAMLGRWLGKPVVITARGSDVNLLPRHYIPRKMILWAAGCAARVITVSAALKNALRELGAQDGNIAVLRNGVDAGFFKPCDREQERARLGLHGEVLLSVGNLVAEKGHDLVIKALPLLDGVTLVVIGEGRERRNLEALAWREGVAERVKFTGGLSQEQLRTYYGAADALVLASGREGWPNVLLEAMACGTPVAACAVGGVPEIVAAPEAGVLIGEHTPQALAQAVRSLLNGRPERGATRRYAERFSWDEITQGQLHLFDEITSGKDSRAAGSGLRGREQ